jgi:hypothetical protein
MSAKKKKYTHDKYVRRPTTVSLLVCAVTNLKYLMHFWFECNLISRPIFSETILRILCVFVRLFSVVNGLCTVLRQPSYYDRSVASGDNRECTRPIYCLRYLWLHVKTGRNELLEIVS